MIRGEVDQGVLVLALGWLWSANVAIRQACCNATQWLKPCLLCLACLPEGVEDPADHVVHLQDRVPVRPVAALALELLLHYEGGVGLRQGVVGQPGGGLAARVLDVLLNLLVDEAGGPGGTG